MDTRRPLRVALIDDDPLVRTGVRLLLRGIPEVDVVAEGSDGTDAIPLLERIPVDVLLMDVRMRRVSGAAVMVTVRQRFPNVRVVLMSAVVDDDFADHAANLGAAAYVPKTADLVTIRTALAGPRVDEPPVTKRLSQQERQVAVLVADGANNADIATELHLSANTVKTYVSRAMSKLGARNRVQLANLLHRDESGRGKVP